MEVRLTPDQEILIQRAIEQGRYRSAEEAVRDAMAQWEERERQRIDLTTDIGRAELELKSGWYSDYTDDTLPLLAEELKREAREMRASLQSR
ncbi:MAG TPA: type II toxin-antitoxin system ParD family antitoxin [Bryobacteraceae bacterium]|nr:type II toxin-antitoxin system ParD family antitoxin [Bryobacteraceae bacterium]